MLFPVCLIILTSAPVGIESAGPLAWSPDGQWLAYVQEVRANPKPLEPGWLFGDTPAIVETIPATGKPKAFRLWTTRPETGESVLLDESDAPISAPAWNRDGTGLAYSRIVRTTDGPNVWEVVVQNAPERRRVVYREPMLGSTPFRIGALVPSWSSADRMLAVPRPGVAGVLILKADTGRVLRTLEHASKPSWTLAGSVLAYVTLDAEPALWVLDTPTAKPRLLTPLSREASVLPSPLWSRDGQSVMILRRTPVSPEKRTASKFDEVLQLARYRSDGSGFVGTDLVHDKLEPEGNVLGVWFTVDEEQTDAFIATACLGQTSSQLNWSSGQFQFSGSTKRINPFDVDSLLGELSIAPDGKRLALRVCTQGSWSPPAICNVESQSLTFLAPGDLSRRECLARILDATLSLLRHHIPDPAMADGTVVDRPTLLPAPGELAQGDEISERLKQLSRMGLTLLGPISAETDETRLAFAYLAGLDLGARKTVARMMTQSTSAPRRFQLLAVEAQIHLGRREFERAKPIIAHLRACDPQALFDLEEEPDGRDVVRTSTPRGGWATFLDERAAAMKKPPMEESRDLVPREALNMDDLRQFRANPPAAPVPF